VKLYRVVEIGWDTTRSWLPLREPVGDEVSAFEASIVPTLPDDTLRQLLVYGYSQHQAQHFYQAVFNHYWYDYGIREVIHCRELTHGWFQTNVGPVWRRTAEAQPMLLTPAVMYFVVVAVVVVVIIIVVNPEWETARIKKAPDNLYVGTYNEELYWMTRVAVSAEGVPWYESVVYQGGVICAFEPHMPLPPGEVDRLHLWGSLDWYFWTEGMYRRWRLGYLDCHFCGFLEHKSAHRYALREGGYDPWAPESAEIVPESEQCRIISPGVWYF
jgi:hypothetical protein